MEQEDFHSPEGTKQLVMKAAHASCRVLHGSTVDMKYDLHEDDELQREH